MNLWQATAEIEAKRVKAKEDYKRWRVWIYNLSVRRDSLTVMATSRRSARAWAARFWVVPINIVAAVDDELFHPGRNT